MESVGNYWLFWGFYLAAAVVFSVVFYRLTKFEEAIWASYSMRAVAAAMIFTPWYSNSQDSLMAPALMVATLDAITVGTGAAIRSFVPLSLTIILALMLATVLSFLKKRKVKTLSNKELE